MLYEVQSKSRGGWSKTVCFVLIQLCFAFFSSASLPEFEGIHMRYTAVIALVLIRESMSQLLQYLVLPKIWFLVLREYQSVTFPEEQKIFLDISYLNPEVLKTNEYSKLIFKTNPFSPFFFFFFFLMHSIFLAAVRVVSFHVTMGSLLKVALSKPYYRHDYFFWHLKKPRTQTNHL